ncbi:thermonuclease family protein [Desulforhopalus sp. IMCC35007]|uniref:thermonuclease family protein n=1 Tax=Desulforhopalus sp. IMCC35007 TaxID=2569543 RepID=UPI0010AE4503|nr:thermonuclease family protein [Desulforhopalus sp. IMCC35007]TKB07459.1 nuclease [Desulforhopalus sp. IMCC35007]
MNIFSIKYPYLWLCFFLTIYNISTSYALTGKVVSIADGDTITILDLSNKQHRIRLYGIDTPEKGQPFGNAAKKHTAQLTYKKSATVNAYDTDKYGRTVGVVTVDGTNVNESLIKNGYAWQYRKYCKADFCDEWLDNEENAKSAKIGLWSDKDPVPPWDWRKGARNSSYQETAPEKYAAVQGGLHGNVKSHVFHAPSCRHYNCKNCTAIFSSKSDALKAGYRTCGQCKP